MRCDASYQKNRIQNYGTQIERFFYFSLDYERSVHYAGVCLEDAEGMIQDDPNSEIGIGYLRIVPVYLKRARSAVDRCEYLDGLLVGCPGGRYPVMRDGLVELNRRFLALWEPTSGDAGLYEESV